MQLLALMYCLYIHAIANASTFVRALAGNNDRELLLLELDGSHQTTTIPNSPYLACQRICHNQPEPGILYGSETAMTTALTNNIIKREQSDVMP